jgi:hypothetical protein
VSLSKLRRNILVALFLGATIVSGIAGSHALTSHVAIASHVTHVADASRLSHCSRAAPLPAPVYTAGGAARTTPLPETPRYTRVGAVGQKWGRVGQG